MIRGIRTKDHECAADGIHVVSAGAVDRGACAPRSAPSLLLEAHPTYTVDDVLLALRSTSTQTAAPDNLLGWGILDAVAAVDLVLPTVEPVLSETVAR